MFYTSTYRIKSSYIYKSTINQKMKNMNDQQAETNIKLKKYETQYLSS